MFFFFARYSSLVIPVSMFLSILATAKDRERERAAVTILLFLLGLHKIVRWFGSFVALLMCLIFSYSVDCFARSAFDCQLPCRVQPQIRCYDVFFFHIIHSLSPMEQPIDNLILFLFYNLHKILFHVEKLDYSQYTTQTEMANSELIKVRVTTLKMKQKKFIRIVEVKTCQQNPFEICIKWTISYEM